MKKTVIQNRDIASVCNTYNSYEKKSDDGEEKIVLVIEKKIDMQIMDQDVEDDITPLPKAPIQILPQIKDNLSSFDSRSHQFNKQGTFNLKSGNLYNTLKSQGNKKVISPTYMRMDTISQNLGTTTPISIDSKHAPLQGLAKQSQQLTGAKPSTKSFR